MKALYTPILPHKNRLNQRRIVGVGVEDGRGPPLERE